MLEWLSNRIHRDAPKTKKRSFSGASTGRLYKDFFSPATSANDELDKSLVTLRSKAREICRNNPYAKRYLEALSVGVLGETGFSFQVKARNPKLKGEKLGKLDDNGNQRIEDAFKKWADHCSADGQLSFFDVLETCLKSLARDGEVLIKKVVSPDYRDGFALQILESDYLDERISRIHSNGNRIIMGVEVNQYNKPIAYWLRDSNGHPTESQSQASGNIRVLAEEIIHLKKPDRAGSVRGESWLAPIMNRLHMLGTYEDAELTASKVGAQKLGFLISGDGEGFIGDDETDEGDQILHSESGSIQQLPEGMTFQDWNPEHPVTAFPDFHKAILRGIASGLNISFHSISMNLESVNYSSIRQGTIEERDYFKKMQKFLISHLAKPIALEWLKYHMTFNQNALPITLYNKFSHSIMFFGRGFAWVDPAKEIKAEAMAIALGIKTRQDVSLQAGRDIEDVFAQIENEKNLAEKYGVILGDEPFGSAHMPVNPVGFEDQSSDAQNFNEGDNQDE